MTNKLTTTYALECPGVFLIEEQTDTYEVYVEGVPQIKKQLGAKSGLQSRALLGLGRGGA